ncbi:protein-export chaperone SecB [Hahella sp. SMD15-11]|uniref:Protein-export protein SecB n=1 Tax=Thermohahella caldifontis TaxID=3142973 RepID=A0AB39UWI5_9GAMM
MAENNAQAQGKQPAFALQRLYLKDLSFESPNSPLIFQTEWQPQVGMDLNTNNTQLSDNQWEVVLTLTITAKLGDKTAFLVEVQQAGIFLIDGLAPQQLAHTLGAFCPNILFPYAREAIDSVVIKGSFPALMLQPINFDAIYAEAIQKQQAGAQTN